MTALRRLRAFVLALRPFVLTDCLPVSVLVVALVRDILLTVIVVAWHSFAEAGFKIWISVDHVQEGDKAIPGSLQALYGVLDLLALGSR